MSDIKIPKGYRKLETGETVASGDLVHCKCLSRHSFVLVRVLIGAKVTDNIFVIRSAQTFSQSDIDATKREAKLDTYKECVEILERKRVALDEKLTTYNSDVPDERVAIGILQGKMAALGQIILAIRQKAKEIENV